MDRKQERGDRPPHAEQEPQQRCDRSRHLRPPPQHEPRVAAVLEPPPDRHAATVPPGMVQGVAGLRPHLAPRGRSKDLNQSATPASLYCWMAPAGSTFFGHTFVHSPTKVHSQIPSLPERSSRRSAAPWSRESML